MISWARHTWHLLRQPGFAGFLGATFALGMGFSFVIPFLSLWGTQEVGFTALQFGLFMTLTSLSAIGLGTVLARWSDTRVPRKVMLLIGATCGVLGYTGYAFVREPLVLVSIGVTLIALSSICFSQLFATARDWFAGDAAVTRDAGITLSIVRVCFSFAWTVGPALGAAIMVHFDFIGLFLGAASLYFLFLLGVWRFAPYQPRPVTVSAAARVPVWQTLRRPDLLGYFVAFVAFFAAFAMNMMNLPLAVSHVLGGTSGDLGIIFGVGPVVEIPLMLWFGQMAARGRQLALIRFGGIVAVAYFALLLLATEVWHVYFIQILSGTAFAIMGNVAIVFFQDLVPGQPGLATTLFANSTSLGNLLGYLGFGTLAAPLGPRGLFGVGVVGAVLCCVLLLRVRPRTGDPLDRSNPSPLVPQA